MELLTQFYDCWACNTSKVMLPTCLRLCQCNICATRNVGRCVSLLDLHIYANPPHHLHRMWCASLFDPRPTCHSSRTLLFFALGSQHIKNLFNCCFLLSINYNNYSFNLTSGWRANKEMCEIVKALHSCWHSKGFSRPVVLMTARLWAAVNGVKPHHSRPHVSRV